jgi:hypothetical protein
MNNTASNGGQYPVNWVDGMKIRAAHFILQENYMRGLVDDVSGAIFGNHNFGLVAHYPGQPTLDLDILGNLSGKMDIVVKEIHAVTRGGYLLDVDVRTHPTGNYPKATLLSRDYAGLPSTDLYVVVVVNSEERRPFGVPDAEEVPLRHPFVQPKVSVEVVQGVNINTQFLHKKHLLVAKLRWNGEFFTNIEQFVAPSVNINSNETLSRFHAAVVNRLKSIQHSCYSIVQKVIRHGMSNSLAKNTDILCRAILTSLANHIFHLTNIVGQQAPIHMVNDISTLALSIQNELKCLPSKEKEELLQYYYQWYGVKPGEMEEIIAAAIELTYDHNNIFEALTASKHFVKLLHGLWECLSNLEYIGQEKENLVIREEKIITAASQKAWSIFD